MSVSVSVSSFFIFEVENRTDKQRRDIITTHSTPILDKHLFEANNLLLVISLHAHKN